MTKDLVSMISLYLSSVDNSTSIRQMGVIESLAEERFTGL